MKTLKNFKLLLVLVVFLASSESSFSQLGFTYFYSKDIKLSSFSNPIVESCTQVRLLVHYSGTSSGTVTSSPYYLDLGETKTITVQVPGGTTVTGYSWKFTMENGEYIAHSSWGYGENIGERPGGGDWCGSSGTNIISVDIEASLTTFFLDGILGF